MAGRIAVGNELEKEQIQAYKQACVEIGNLFDTLDSDAIFEGDFFDRKWKQEPFVDFVFTDPPFFDMDKRKKSPRFWAGKGSKERHMTPFKKTLYSSKADWIEFMTRFGRRSMELAKPGKYMAFFMEDAYLDGRYEKLTHFSSMTVEASGWIPQGEYIWYNEARRPGIFGYPVKMITNRTHTSILFFQKAKI